MKQSILLKKLYKACLNHDSKTEGKLRKKELKKIIKHRKEGKKFDAKWTIIV